MFNISDRELEGIEAKSSRREEPARAYMPIPGYGFGDDSSSDPSMPAAPPVAAPAAMPSPVVVAPPVSAPSSGSVASGAGKALLLVTAGLVAGAIAAGAWGAAAGVATAGAARNLARTKQLWNSPDPNDRSEAGKSATMGIFGLGIAGMIGYHAYKIRSKEESFPW